jgi:hypothetical protein
MKKTNTIYWILTGLFAGFMFLTAIPDVLISPDAVAFMMLLGYPNYFIPFIGVAKMLGAIAIVIPGFPRIKEWAYAGLFFDLIGAVYSVIAVGQGSGALFILLPIVIGAGSYIYYHKRLKAPAIA